VKPAPIYAWVTVMADGRPSIVGTYMPEMRAHMPLVGFTRAHIERFGDFARAHGEALGQPVYFVEFGTMTVLTPTN
jgi:hypothetical protein